jgi:aryl-phospho-beta-D-glucosidase BglC (GH1 family)
MLGIRGADIVDEQGRMILLRGVGLGGWMNMENFITGYAANEESMRAAIRQELGEEQYGLFFDRFLEYFFGDADADFLRSIGLNLVRIPINYRHFESDMQPFSINHEGFKHLDRVIDACARHGIYTIIDLHAAQGYQNQDWHSDNPTHRAFLWTNKHFQDRATGLWEAIAARYRGNRWVAGYNLLNEPNDPVGNALIPVTRRLYDAVLAVDPEHLVFIDANRYSSDFSLFPDPWPNVVYSFHDYAMCGFIEGVAYPGENNGVWCDPAWLERHFLKKAAYARSHQVPMWVGEFGPVYTGHEGMDAFRYDLLRDQIALFDRYGAHWALWTYKDIGRQGVVYAASNSPYVKRLEGFLAKKSGVGADTWGNAGQGVAGLITPIEERLTRELGQGTGDLWLVRDLAKRLIRGILFSEALLPEYAALFRGMSDDEIDEMMRSFSFERCVVRSRLVDVLARESVRT